MRKAAIVVAAACVAIGCSRERTRETAATDTAIVGTQAAAQTPASVQPGTKSNYVGLQYDSLPKDFTFKAGAVLPRRGTAEYDLSYVATPVGDEVWLDTLGAPVGKGLRARIVRAELKVPPLASDERMFMASCDLNGKLDPNVVAIVINEAGTSRFTRIRQAWRVNIPQSRFDVIPVTGVTCEEPGG